MPKFLAKPVIAKNGGDEGGELLLEKADTNTTINTGVTIDVYQNKLRIFEQGGSARGAYIDITTAGAGVASNLLGASQVTINPQTATYTLVLSDAGKMIEMGVGSANILYVPTNASVAFPIGTSIDILQTGAGKTQIAAVTSGTTTINSASGFYLRTTWSAATLVKRATDTWVLFGDTSTT